MGEIKDVISTMSISAHGRKYLFGVMSVFWLTLVFEPAEALLPPTPVVGDVLQSMVTYSFPAAPLARHSSEIQLIPAYFTYSGDYTDDRFGRHEVNHEKGSGGAGAASYTFWFNSFWGISVVAGGAAQSGQTSSAEGLTVPPIDGWNGPTSEADFHSKDIAISLNMVFDPLGTAERFRLPIFAGLAYEWVSMDSDPLSFQYTTPPSGFATPARLARVGHQATTSFSSSQNGVGVTAGIAPKMTAGPFRLSPFGFFYQSFVDENQDVTVEDLTTGEKSTTRFQYTPEAVFGYGVDVMFVPWNLSFRYIPPSGSDLKPSVISLAWSKRWGQ